MSMTRKGNRMNFIFKILLVAIVTVLSACHNRNNPEESDAVVVKTPVTASVLELGSISETISLNATSAYLIKNEIRSNVNGYVEKVYVRIGDRVKAGSPLFKMKTKEAQVLEELALADSSMKIRGEVLIAAPASGIIISVAAQEGSYVSDGDVAAVMADQKSFVFILHVPYELREYTRVSTSCRIILPDSASLTGKVASRLSEVDPVSQTQSYIVRVQSDPAMPENLAVEVELNRNTRTETQILEKSCILSDEVMENFWVMKLINDSTAVKVPVKMGISTDTKIEILLPLFSPGERFVSSGCYGLPDTANVVIRK